MRLDPCPSCSGRTTAPSYKTTIDILRPEWVSSMNKIDIDQGILPMRYWWRCPLDPCGCHLYTSTLSNRLQGNQCPYCSGFKVCYHSNLEATHARLIPYWSEANKKPMRDYRLSKCVAIWRCPECGYGWSGRIDHIARRRTICFECKRVESSGGPKYEELGVQMTGMTRFLFKNNLGLKHPELLEIWDPKNPFLPQHYHGLSKRLTLWRCSGCGHRWKRRIYEQVTIGPVCEMCAK